MLSRGVAVRDLCELRIGECSDRWELVREDLDFLVSTGTHDSETLARRLGFSSVETLERYLYRHSIPVSYKPKREIGIKVAAIHRSTDVRPYAQLDPGQVNQAVACVKRQFRDDPGIVPGVLAMLGLPGIGTKQSEQQLTP